MEALCARNPELEPIRSLPPGARALVVENRRYRSYSRDTLRPGLQSLGLEVFLASSTERAARVLERVPIDLLILDMHGTGALLALNWLRSGRVDHPDLVFIATAHERNDELEQRCDALGATAFLALPVSFRTLRRCIERAFVARRHLLEIRRLKQELDAATTTAARTAPGDGHEPEHYVDDLWFAIFEQLLSGKGHLS